MKVFNSRDLDWRSARRNLARAFYHSSDFDSIGYTFVMLQALLKYAEHVHVHMHEHAPGSVKVIFKGS